MNSGKESRGVVAYLLITFGIAWGCWCIPLLFGIRLSDPRYAPVFFPAVFAPAIAAFVVRKWVTREGFADAGLRLNLRRAWRYYLIAWLLPVFVVAGIVVLAVVFGVARPDWRLEHTIRAFPAARVRDFLRSLPDGLRLPLAATAQGLTALLAAPILWGEEFGWRGYLQVRLLRGRPVRAAIATGIIWGIWHYPMNLQGYNYPNNRILGLFIFPVFTVLLSIIFGWLRQKTGSVWAPSLAHAATNAVGLSLTGLLFTPGSPHWVWVSYAGVLEWVPLGVVCAWIALTGGFRANSVKADRYGPR